MLEIFLCLMSFRCNAIQLRCEQINIHTDRNKNDHPSQFLTKLFSREWSEYENFAPSSFCRYRHQLAWVDCAFVSRIHAFTVSVHCAHASKTHYFAWAPSIWRRLSNLMRIYPKHFSVFSMVHKRFIHVGMSGNKHHMRHACASAAANGNWQQTEKITIIMSLRALTFGVQKLEH